MPVGHVLIRDSRGDVEHDNPALTAHVVSVSETSKFLLSSCVPDVEADRAKVGREFEGVDFNSKGG